MKTLLTHQPIRNPKFSGKKQHYLSILVLIILIYPYQGVAALDDSKLNSTPTLTGCCDEVILTHWQSGCDARITTTCPVKSVEITLTNQATLASADWTCDPIQPGFQGMSNWVFTPSPGSCTSLDMTLSIDPMAVGATMYIHITFEDGTTCDKDIKMDCAFVQTDCCATVGLTFQNYWDYNEPKITNLMRRNGVFHIGNQLNLNTSICYVSISYSTFGSFTCGQLLVDGVISGDPWTSTRIPATGSLSDPAATSIDFNLTADGYNGVVTICVHKCDGTICCFALDWQTLATDLIPASLEAVLITQRLRGIKVIPLAQEALANKVKYISFGLITDSTNTGIPGFFAISAGRQVGGISDKDLAICENTYMGITQAFFTLNEPRDIRDIGSFNLVFTDDYKELGCTLYDEEGTILASGVVEVTGATEVATSLETNVLSPIQSGLLEFLNLFANPNNGLFTIQFATDRTRDLEVKIIDSQGKVVYSERQEACQPGIHNLNLNVTHLPKGNYFVRIFSEGSTTSKPLLIN